MSTVALAAHQLDHLLVGGEFDLEEDSLPSLTSWKAGSSTTTTPKSRVGPTGSQNGSRHSRRGGRPLRFTRFQPPRWTTDLCAVRPKKRERGFPGPRHPGELLTPLPPDAPGRSIRAATRGGEHIPAGVMGDGDAAGVVVGGHGAAWRIASMRRVSAPPRGSREARVLPRRRTVGAAVRLAAQHLHHDSAVDDGNEMAIGHGIQQMLRPWPIDAAHEHVAVERGREPFGAEHDAWDHAQVEPRGGGTAARAASCYLRLREARCNIGVVGPDCPVQVPGLELVGVDVRQMP